MRNHTLQVLGVVLLLVAVGCQSHRTSDNEFDTVIKNAMIYDGTGDDPYPGDVAIKHGRIAAIGKLGGRTATTVIDAKGLALAPGFIDNHSHHSGGIQKYPDAIACVNQGITTVVVGQDGGSNYPLKDFFRRLEDNPPAINFASYLGFGTLRDLVMEKDYKRFATQDEIEQMKTLAEQEMAAGALGLSTGLEYDPGIYSDPKEVVEVAKTVSALGGRYISHMRSEDRYYWEAIDELLNIGEEANIPVQITHLKLCMQQYFGRTDEVITILDNARERGIDVTADIYPYTYWQSNLTVLMPSRDYTNREEAIVAITEVTTSEGLFITRYPANPELEDKTLAEIAEDRDQDPVDVFMDLLVESTAYAEETGRGTGIIGVSMDETDIENFMNWDHIAFCTDGSLNGKHPRGYGSYTRILGDYVRQRKIMPLQTAIMKMTSRAAKNVGILNRGIIQKDMYADLVLFNPDTVIDHATMTAPNEKSEGIQIVIVNGKIVYQDNQPTGNRPGKVIRKNQQQ